LSPSVLAAPLVSTFVIPRLYACFTLFDCEDGSEYGVRIEIIAQSGEK
jgi:hypothetical protein